MVRDFVAPRLVIQELCSDFVNVMCTKPNYVKVEVENMIAQNRIGIYWLALNNQNDMQ